MTAPGHMHIVERVVHGSYWLTLMLMQSFLLHSDHTRFVSYASGQPYDSLVCNGTMGALLTLEIGGRLWMSLARQNQVHTHGQCMLVLTSHQNTEVTDGSFGWYQPVLILALILQQSSCATSLTGKHIIVLAPSFSSWC